MVYNTNHKEELNFVDDQLIIQTNKIQRIFITVTDTFLIFVRVSCIAHHPGRLLLEMLRNIQSMTIAVRSGVETI